MGRWILMNVISKNFKGTFAPRLPGRFLALSTPPPPLPTPFTRTQLGKTHVIKPRQKWRTPSLHPPLLHRRSPRLRGRVSLARLVHYPAASPVSSVFAIPWKQICCKIDAALLSKVTALLSVLGPLARFLSCWDLSVQEFSFFFLSCFRGIVIKRLRVTLMVHGRRVVTVLLAYGRHF